MEEEKEGTMRTDFMSIEDARVAVDWLSARIREKTGNQTLNFPADWMPDTGLAVLDGKGKTLAVATLYLEKSSPVAVAGWCIANPENPACVSDKAVRLLLASMPVYAKSKGARHLLTMYGNRGINRILDEMNFIPCDPDVEEKYILL